MPKLPQKILSSGCEIQIHKRIQNPLGRFKVKKMKNDCKLKKNADICRNLKKIAELRKYKLTLKNF